MMSGTVTFVYTVKRSLKSIIEQCATRWDIGSFVSVIRVERRLHDTKQVDYVTSLRTMTLMTTLSSKTNTYTLLVMTLINIYVHTNPSYT